MGADGATGPGQMNPNYPNAYSIPSEYAVALSKMELLKSADDPAPYVLFESSSGHSRQIAFTADTTLASIGENPAYPAAGTYNFVRFTCMYQQMTILADVGDGNGYTSHSFRVYNSTVGSVQDGDVLISVGGVWNWIKGGGFYPITGARPDDTISGLLASHSYLASDESPDPNVVVLPLAQPLVIPANPTGMYRITASFDITQSPDEPGSTGTFVWDDVTPDGMFKPGVDMAQGGDGNAADYATKGAPEWTPLGPTITFTCQ